MKFDLFEGTVKAYLAPNKKHPDYRVKVGEFESLEEANTFISESGILAKYPTKEENIKILGSHDEPRFCVSLIERDTKEEFGEFESIEALNEYIASSRLQETRPDKVIALEFNGVAGEQHPMRTAYWFADCGLINEEEWVDIQKWVEKDAALTIDIDENHPLSPTYDSLSDFHLMMYVFSPTRELIYEGEYINFFRVNEFIRSTMDKPEYEGATFILTAVEILDGISREHSYAFDFDTYEVISQEDIDAMNKHMVDFSDELDNDCGDVRTPLHPDQFKEAEDCNEKEAFRSEYTYICPNCLRELNDCRCGEYPEQLVKIDTILLPIIRELNNKLYRTAFSCAGHQPGDQMYISFQHWYDIDAPKEFHYSCYDFCLFRPCPDGLSDEEYRTFRQESADTLLKWAQELPECPWPDGL